MSNQEYLAFVEAGGYQQDRFWGDEGRSWRQFAKARHPTFWRWHNGWHLRLMTEKIEMPWDWPVEVNYHEARAFCEWKREQTGEPIRLPTEDEWYRLCSAAGIEEVSHHTASANLHLDHGASSCPVTHFRHGEWFDVVGNGWQLAMHSDGTFSSMPGSDISRRRPRSASPMPITRVIGYWPNTRSFTSVTPGTALKTFEELGLDESADKVSFHQ